MASYPLVSGKIPVRLLNELLVGLPASPGVRLGPAIGEDACAIEVGSELLVAATDPVTLTVAEAGYLSVVVSANDVAVTGARPRWFLAVLLLPPGTTGEAVRSLLAEIGRGLERVGAYLVGGHTEVTSAVSRPVVVGQMLGLAEAGRVVASSGLRVGDAVVQVGPAPVEGAAVLAREATARLDGVAPAMLEAARAALECPGISVVEPALLATRLGATAMHDPTEGGLAAGLHELACASGLRIRVMREAMLWYAPGVTICEALGADPWASLASGTLLAAFPSERLEAAMAAFAQADNAAAVIGSAEVGSGVVGTDGAEIVWPDRDELARLG